jgi:hypothetical protein
MKASGEPGCPRGICGDTHFFRAFLSTEDIQQVIQKWRETKDSL